MRTLASMTVSEIEQYIQMVGQATATIVPPDGTFCVIINRPDGRAHYVSNAERSNIPTMLRELADALDAEMARDN